MKSVTVASNPLTSDGFTTDLSSRDPYGIAPLNSREFGSYNHGTIIQVTTFKDELINNGKTSLREAIDYVNLHPLDNITIQLKAGTYRLTLTGSNEDSNATGDLDIADRSGKLAIVTTTGRSRSADCLTGLSAKHPLVTIDAEGLGDRIFDINATEVSLDRLKLQHGTAEGQGGAIANRGTLAITNSVLEHNSAATAGAIANTGTLTIQNSHLSHNQATNGNGGAILNTDQLTLLETELERNSATNNGGAVWNKGELTLNRSKVTKNRADQDKDGVGQGGGIYSFSEIALIGKVRIKHNTPDNIFIAPSPTLRYTQHSYSSGTYTGIQLIDMDDDGRPEVVAGHRETNSIEVWKYDNSSETLNLVETIPFSYHVHDFQVADFDHDGDKDIVAGIRFSGLEYAANQGDGTWSLQRIDPTYSWRVLVDDFDGDGNLDICDGVDYEFLKIFYGDGQGNFQQGAAPERVIGDTNGMFFNSADVNNDGRNDLIGLEEASHHHQGNYLRVYLNLGDRQWSESVGPASPFAMYPFLGVTTGNSSAGDVDHNGYIDQVFGVRNDTDLSANTDLFIFMGDSSNGNLTWTQHKLDQLPGTTGLIGMADFNDDGHLDVYANGPYYSPQSYLYVYLGDGTGNFTKQIIDINTPVGDYHCLAVGDLNGDGASDIVNAVGFDGTEAGFNVLLQQ